MEPTNQNQGNAETESSNAPGSKKAWEPIRFERLAAKELRETLRDRRTIVTLFLMPLLVYPILSLLFQGFLVTNLTSTDAESDEAPRYRFVFASEEQLRSMLPLLQKGYVVTEGLDRTRQRMLNPESDESGSSGEDEPNTSENSQDPSGDDEQPQSRLLAEQHDLTYVEQNSLDAVKEVISRNEADVGLNLERVAVGDRQVNFLTLTYQEGSSRSLEALKFITRILDFENIATQQSILRSRGIPPADRPIRESVGVRVEQQNAISFVALIPLILTLMTMTGAVYPAIDLTAGERERGTLESLIASPVPRMRILLGKLVAIVVVALMTAVVNLVGMTVTIWVFQLDSVLFGESGLSWYSVVQVFGLLVLFAGFFASVLLVITSFARSFKEGQAYLIPLMMLALAPSLMSLKPDLELRGLWSILPLVNIVLLARDVLTGNINLGPSIVAIASTIFYAALAITIAARFFGTPQVLYGESQGIGTLFSRPREKRQIASASLAMLCLALLFPASFIWQGVLGRVATATTPTAQEQEAEPTTEAAIEPLLDPIAIQAILTSLGVAVVFFLVPWLMTQFHRVRFVSGYGLRRPSLTGMAAAALLGIGLGPLLMQTVASSGLWIELLQGEGQQGELLARAEEQAAKLRTLPIWAVLIAFALVPAIFEELFFRGLLFQSLRGSLSPWKTIIATGLMFGAFHLITTSGLGLSRILPTTAMGFVLGWVCWRTGSVIPGMILHGIHNALALSLAYYRDDMVSAGWITADQNTVPAWILAIGGALTIAGVTILLIRKSRNPDGQ